MNLFYTEEIMNKERTRNYYKELVVIELCQCDYCLNYYEEVEKEYPELAQYLDELGIDIQKPFETMPLEVDKDGFIEYIGAQYIVFGNDLKFNESKIEDAKIYIETSHPSTVISEKHFVIEVSPIRLRWIME